MRIILRNIILIILLVIFKASTVFSQTNDKTFDLVRDIGNFSEFMTELDTIVVNADFSICNGEHFEKDIITKQNDSVFIEVFIENDFKGKLRIEF
ncbi:hypothetical protein DF185_00530 [Marinifilum breve]|uniref:Uncharacterized protein n=1 Tax=Marinifilum breve TaxID=2184082 RepID=A0A2V4A2P7_9BACT|nr:hypothetical protein [Marinifilum breve]PXY02613.1 hypothetical protein DF185_00530 [Marinifilum breve]